MMLWRYELKKTLINQKGIWILLACLVLKIVLLAVFPEQKDGRIMLTQRQYDKYLAQLQGENTPEKSDWILTEYADFQQTKSMYTPMQNAYSAGELTEEEWKTFTEAYTEAELKMNSAAIFAEKAGQFLEHPTDVPAAHYIYEYGWQSVYTLLQFPDVFLLFGILLLTSLSLPSEHQSGMMPVLLGCRNGRRQLYLAKLGSLLTVCIVSCALFGGMEWAAFQYRGWMNDGHVPLYSISIFAECTPDMTLLEGYWLTQTVRLGGTVLFTVLMFGLSVWVRSITELLFAGLCLLAVPMLWDGGAMLFTHSGLLRGTKMLLWQEEMGLVLWIPTLIIAAYSVVTSILAEKRLERGL